LIFREGIKISASESLPEENQENLLISPPNLFQNQLVYSSGTVSLSVKDSFGISDKLL